MSTTWCADISRRMQQRPSDLDHDHEAAIIATTTASTSTSTTSSGKSLPSANYDSDDDNDGKADEESQKAAEKTSDTSTKTNGRKMVKDPKTTLLTLPSSRRSMENVAAAETTAENIGPAAAADSTATTTAAADSSAAVIDENAQNRFICQSWSRFREFVDLSSKRNCDSITEDSGGSKTKDKKLAVLPHSKFAIYGFFPSRDEYVVAKCKLCGMALKPVAHRAHMHLRHNIGMKSPEPLTPVVSAVISPAMFSSSTSPPEAAACSKEQAQQHQDDRPPGISTAGATRRANDKVISKPPIKKTNNLAAARKAAAATLSTTNEDTTLSSSSSLSKQSADSYVVVAPHSSDRPLKLTFRRAGSNANLAGAAVTTATASASKPPVSSGPILAVAVSGGGGKELKKARGITTRPRTDSSGNYNYSSPLTTAAAVKSRLRGNAKPSYGSAAESSFVETAQLQQQQQRRQQKAGDFGNPISAATPSNNCKLLPSTSSVELAIGGESTLTWSSSKMPSSSPTFVPPAAITITTNSGGGVNGFHNHVYEHPRPLAACRFDQRLPPLHHQQSSSSRKTHHHDADAGSYYYFMAGYYQNSHKRWPTLRRSSQTLRTACHRMFTAQDVAVASGSYNSGVGVDGNGPGLLGSDQARGTENRWRQQQQHDGPNGGHSSHIIRRALSNAHHYHHHKASSSSPIAIVRHSGVNNRVVRVTNPVKNCNTAGAADNHQPRTSILITGGGRYSVGGATTPNAGMMNNNHKGYMKVNSNQAAANVVDTTTGGGAPHQQQQLAIDLGSLVTCNGDSSSSPSTFQIRLEPATSAISRQSSAGGGGEMITVKRSAPPPNAFPSSSSSAVNSYVGCEVSASKKPRLQNHHDPAASFCNETEAIGGVDTNNSYAIPNTGIKSTLVHAHARQQLIHALQQAHDSAGSGSGGTVIRRKFSQPHAAAVRRHQHHQQLTPIVISPSQTPRCSSPRPPPPQQQQQSFTHQYQQHQQSQPQQHQQQPQVVLVSVNGPAVLTGWQKLSTTAAVSGTGEQQQQQQQSGLPIQNGLTVTAVGGAMESAAAATVTVSGARLLRPKMAGAGATSSSHAVPVLVTAHSVAQHQQQQQQHYRQLQVAQHSHLNLANTSTTYATTMNNISSSSVYGMKKHPTHARIYRRAVSAAVSPIVEDASSSTSSTVFHQFAQQQQPQQTQSQQQLHLQLQQQQQSIAQYRSIQPAAQQPVGSSSSLLRSTAGYGSSSSPQLVAAPIVFSVAAVPKGGSNTPASSSSSPSPAFSLGQEFSHQSPVSAAPSAAAGNSPQRAFLTN